MLHIETQGDSHYETLKVLPQLGTLCGTYPSQDTVQVTLCAPSGEVGRLRTWLRSRALAQYAWGPEFDPLHRPESIDT